MTSWVNGLPGTSIDVRDRGLHYGDGCFETIMVAERRLKSLDRHLLRLRRGATALGIALPEEAALRAQLQLAADCEPGTGVVKLLVTRGVTTARGYRPQGTLQATIIVSRYPSSPVPDSLRVHVSAVTLGHNALLAGIKHLNRLEQVLAQRQLDGDCDEVIMLDQAGHAVCGSMSNLFVVDARGLVTPSLDRCGVAGVMRSWVMDGARALSIPMIEAEIPLAELLSAPAVCLSNVRIGLCPVRSLEGRELPVDARVAALRAWISAHVV